jgi:hypothetical protein
VYLCSEIGVRCDKLLPTFSQNWASTQRIGTLTYDLCSTPELNVRAQTFGKAEVGVARSRVHLGCHSLTPPAKQAKQYKPVEQSEFRKQVLCCCQEPVTFFQLSSTTGATLDFCTTTQKKIHAFHHQRLTFSRSLRWCQNLSERIARRWCD